MYLLHSPQVPLGQGLSKEGVNFLALPRLAPAVELWAAPFSLPQGGGREAPGPRSRAPGFAKAALSCEACTHPAVPATPAASCGLGGCQSGHKDL